MANSFAVSKAQLIYALCLPLAVLVGYLLADPTDAASFLFFLALVGVLAIPVLLRWHHWLLLAAWNAAIAPAFLPGQPASWMLMAAASLLFAVLNRSISAEQRFIHVPAITRPLLFFAAVVVGTAFLTGGVGLRSLGSSTYGGKNYVYLLLAIGGYFALTSQRIPTERANTAVAVFYLSTLTALITLAYLAGPTFYFVFDFVPAGHIAEQAQAEYADALYVRYTSLALPSAGLYSFLLARYGWTGLLEMSKPWRLVLFVLAAAGCLLTGFRSNAILLILTCLSVFCLEGLWRTRLLPVVVAIAILCGGVLLVSSDRLPMVVQRSLAFLPLKLDTTVKQNAEASSEWRLEMWRAVLPTVPKYLLKGKGYALDPNDLFLARESTMRGFAPLYNPSSTAGDYHNGPLSVLIPFGLFGFVAFAWFVAAALKVLYENYRYGAPELKRINTFLLATFMTKLMFFLLVFGALAVEFCVFTGLAGLSVSLNGGVAQAPQPEEETTEELGELEFAEPESKA